MTGPTDCWDVAESCRCCLDAGHESDIHVCECKGSWRKVDGLIEPVTWPGSGLPNTGLDSILAEMDRIFADGPA